MMENDISHFYFLFSESITELEGIKYIAEGLKENTTLKELRLAIDNEEFGISERKQIGDEVAAVNKHVKIHWEVWW